MAGVSHHWRGCDLGDPPSLMSIAAVHYTKFAQQVSMDRVVFSFTEDGQFLVFVKEGIAEILNLQPLASGKTKPYQVKQVRTVIVRHRLGEEI